MVTARGVRSLAAPLIGAALLVLASGCRASGASAAERERAAAASDYVPRPPGPGESALAIRCSKLVTCDDENRIFDPGLVVVRDGKIEYVGPPVPLPDGFPAQDFPSSWVSPGMVDLHSHVQSGDFGDINDMVKPVNPELRTRAVVVPSNPFVRRACAGGVTTLFGIPGSGTSISGFGVVYKTKTDAGYEECVLKDPGGMKCAWNFNPQRTTGDLGATWAGLSWGLEDLNDRAVAALDSGRADPALADLVRVHAGELPVLVHCASAEGVAGTVRMWKVRYDTKCVVSHGSWDGHLAGAYAAEHGVPVNHGPRTMNFTSMRREDRILGGAAAYLEAGVPDFSLNTDAPVVPQEELFLQGSMSARLGADAYTMLRAITANPARSLLIGDRVGSLAPGKDGDLVVSSGDPLDPRSRVELVVIDGQIQYSRLEDGQWF